MIIEAQTPVAGFELFTTRNGAQLGGYAGMDLARTEGVLPLLETEGATGVAFVNAGDASGTVVVTAYNDAGYAVEETTIVLQPFEKRVAVAARLFEGNISGATFLHYASDKKIVIFQLNTSSDMQMLDALPGL